MKRMVVFAALVLAACRRDTPHQSDSPSLTAATLKAPLTVLPQDIQWGPPPAGLPPGSQAAVVQGDPGAKNALFALRAKLPPGYRVMPHWHPGDEHVTVLSGLLMVGHGDKFEPEKMTALPPGGLAVMPAGHHHFAMAGTTETIIQVHGVGPFGITYINPADDPRNVPPK